MDVLLPIALFVFLFVGLALVLRIIIWFLGILHKAFGIETFEEKKAREQKEIDKKTKQREQDQKKAQHDAYMDRLFPDPEKRKKADEYLKANSDEIFTAFSQKSIESIVERETEKRMQESNRIVPFVKEVLGLKDGDAFILAEVNRVFDKMSFDEKFQYDVMSQEERNTFWTQWAEQFKGN
jgi:hypothetical protein